MRRGVRLVLCLLTILFVVSLPARTQSLPDFHAAATDPHAWPMPASMQTVVTGGTAAFSGFAGISFQDVKLTSAPVNPASGFIRLYGDSGTSNFTCLTSAGGSCLPGGGTVTHTAGALTSTALVTGNGGADLQTPSATSTLSASGNMSLAGSLTGTLLAATGTCRTQATGCLDLTAGTTPNAPAAGVSSISLNSNGDFLFAPNGGAYAPLRSASVNFGVVVSVSFSATPTFTFTAAAQETIFTMTLTGNVTSSTLSGGVINSDVCFILTQDATGGRTFVWPTTVKGGPSPLVTTANGVTSACFVNVDGTNWQNLDLTPAVAAGGSVSGLTAATVANTINNANNPQTWNWAQTTNTQDAMLFGETSAATGGTLTGGLANQALVAIIGATNSTETILEVAQGSITNTVATPIAQFEGTWNNASLAGAGIVESVTETADAAGSSYFQIFGGVSGATSEFNVAKGGAGAFATSVSTGTAPACAAGTSGVLCLGVGTVSTGAANVVNMDASSTQLALGVNNNNTGSMMLSRSSCVNVTPVTTSGGSVTTDQNMMSCTLSANLLNVVGRILKIYAAGTYSTAAASSSAMTLKAKLCTVSGCGSGTVVAVCNIVTSALGAITITSNTWTLECIPITQTAGASSVYERSGRLSMDLLVANAAADSIFLDPNATAVTSPVIDSTPQLFLQISGAFSVASASNSFTQRQLFVEALN